MVQDDLRATVGDLRCSASPADASQIEVPTRVVAGAHSEPLRDGARALAATTPSASSVEFPDANHATYVQAPTEFAAMVRSFVDSIR